MKTELENKLNQEARYLRISIPYDKEEGMATFDDGVMTELECDDGFVPPMLCEEDQILEYVIDLKDRKVFGWNYKEGNLKMRAKVRDSGTYTLLDENRQPLWQICGYVPNRLIPPFERGYGDYIELAVEADGTIVGWPQTPDLSEFVANGKAPEPVKTNKWHKVERALWYLRSLSMNEAETAWLIEQLKGDR